MGSQQLLGYFIADYVIQWTFGADSGLQLGDGADESAASWCAGIGEAANRAGLGVGRDE